MSQDQSLICHLLLSMGYCAWPSSKDPWKHQTTQKLSDLILKTPIRSGS